jgi:hypothetical protein
MRYSADFREKTDNVINGGVSTIKTNNAGALWSRHSWTEYLKYCTLCVAEDNAIYGETYWRRQHQLSEMFYCTHHQVRLINSEINIRKTGAGFFPASTIMGVETTIDNYDELSQFKEKLLQIGRESEWLIQHGLEVDWQANRYKKCGFLLRDRKLASVNGRCDYIELERSFNDYWGKDFLEMLQREVRETNFNGWRDQIANAQMRVLNPMYRTLLMCFLADSISNFIDSNPADTAYGHPPYECENSVCSHYHIDGAEMVSL